MIIGEGYPKSKGAFDENENGHFPCVIPVVLMVGGGILGNGWHK